MSDLLGVTVILLCIALSSQVPLRRDVLKSSTWNEDTQSWPYQEPTKGKEHESAPTEHDVGPHIPGTVDNKEYRLVRMAAKAVVRRLSLPSPPPLDVLIDQAADYVLKKILALERAKIKSGIHELVMITLHPDRVHPTERKENPVVHVAVPIATRPQEAHRIRMEIFLGALEEVIQDIIIQHNLTTSQAKKLIGMAIEAISRKLHLSTKEREGLEERVTSHVRSRLQWEDEDNKDAPLRRLEESIEEDLERYHLSADKLKRLEALRVEEDALKEDLSKEEKVRMLKRVYADVVNDLREQTKESKAKVPIFTSENKAALIGTINRTALEMGLNAEETELLKLAVFRAITGLTMTSSPVPITTLEARQSSTEAARTALHTKTSTSIKASTTEPSSNTRTTTGVPLKTAPFPSTSAQESMVSMVTKAPAQTTPSPPTTGSLLTNKKQTKTSTAHAPVVTSRHLGMSNKVEPELTEGSEHLLTSTVKTTVVTKRVTFTHESLQPSEPSVPGTSTEHSKNESSKISTTRREIATGASEVPPTRLAIIRTTETTEENELIGMLSKNPAQNAEKIIENGNFTATVSSTAVHGTKAAEDITEASTHPTAETELLTRKTKHFTRAIEDITQGPGNSSRAIERTSTARPITTVTVALESITEASLAQTLQPSEGAKTTEPILLERDDNEFIQDTKPLDPENNRVYHEETSEDQDLKTKKEHVDDALEEKLSLEEELNEAEKLQEELVEKRDPEEEHSYSRKRVLDATEAKNTRGQSRLEDQLFRL